MAERADMTVERVLKEVRKRGLLSQIESDIVTAKALDFLVAQAVVSETEPS